MRKADCDLRLSDKIESAKVFVGPGSLNYHASESLGRESVSEPMVGYNYSAPIRVTVYAVAAPGSSRYEAVLS